MKQKGCSKCGWPYDVFHICVVPVSAKVLKEKEAPSYMIAEDQLERARANSQIERQRIKDRNKLGADHGQD